MVLRVYEDGKPAAWHHLLEAINKAAVVIRKELGFMQWQRSMAKQQAACLQSKRGRLELKVSVTLKFNVVLNV
jgi:hypothetical protein